MWRKVPPNRFKTKRRRQNCTYKRSGSQIETLLPASNLRRSGRLKGISVVYFIWFQQLTVRMSGDGLCWCASASKCPHGISAKLPALWEDMEKVIDEVLQQFDRKTIKRFLKRDVDGNSKGTVAEQMKTVTSVYNTLVTFYRVLNIFSCLTLFFTVYL